MSGKMFGFDFEELDTGGVADKISSSKSIDIEEVERQTKQAQHEHGQQLRQFVDFGGFDDLYLDVVSPPFQSCAEEIKMLVQPEPENVMIVEHEKEKLPYAASLEILNKHRRRLKRLHNEKLNVSECNKENGQKVSTIEILRLAGQSFVQSSLKGSQLSVLIHPYASSFAGLSEDDTKDVQLVQYLLAAAEKVGEKQYYRATKLLKKCDKMSFEKGNPVQRLVHYFSAALHERIDRETGRCAAKGTGKMLSIYVGNILSSTNASILAFQKAVPFSHVSQFAGIQAILEQVADARKVHIIDLQIRMGTQYTILMQALAAQAECPIEGLKITAVGTNCKASIEETGKRLASFADSFNLAFSFSMIVVENMEDLKEDDFELDEDEAVVVYAEYILMLMIQNPKCVESLMRVIQDINPRAMVVTEVEANHNSPVFVDRFTEALFYHGAFFAALSDCFKDDDAHRMVMESMLFGQGIKNIVAAEGEERTIRHVKVKVWREFFTRFGMMEMELSMSSKYQANLVLNNFPCGSSCTLDMDGECLIVGWKGVPTQSLSVWKFRRLHLSFLQKTAYKTIPLSR
ncbi:hypothetical protein M9H77_36916 [Catharanthus roseus]|uniref:Uncharacterized protein n=1 Tax=Catharanthus roseus TaxID=4058 RepID=A0ACB9ZUH4_CATRO|nr:hypothetical protein M9H77_36916 [Catharanthus roseus]